MSTTRRAFLIATGACGMLWPMLDVAVSTHPPEMRTLVIDRNLPESRAWVRHAQMQLNGARIEPLFGDAGWLWFERLSCDALRPLHGIGGLTRFADAFVLTQLGAGIGMCATRRMLDEDAVLWTMTRRPMV